MLPGAPCYLLGTLEGPPRITIEPQCREPAGDKVEGYGDVDRGVMNPRVVLPADRCDLTARMTVMWLFLPYGFRTT